jgi:diketogulonate reductase-like aldo/keto reductase
LTAAITGASTPMQAQANAAAADIELTAEQRARLEARWGRVELSSSPPPARRLLVKLQSLLSRLRG